jgi:photosystem II stability/assembly factor-like uncharacterized protein
MAIAAALGVSLSTGFQGAAAAAAEAKPSAAARVPPDAAAWRDLTPAVAAISRDPLDIALCAVAVDRTSGWLYIQPQDCGLWRSTDQGRTFQQIGQEVINKGTRHSHSWASVQVHPEGGKITVYSMCSYWRVPMGLCGYSLDGGNTWKEFVKFGRQPTAGTMNWDGDCSVVLCGGWPDHRGLFYSSDGGAHWIRRDWSKADTLHQRFGFFYQGFGIFSPRVLVTSTGEATLRSEDAGKTWTEIGKHGASGPVWFFKGKPYWMSGSGVLTTDDAGKTWTLVGSKLPTFGVAGPYFGKDERHIVVATATGFYETFDGGAAWHKLAPYPPAVSGVGFLWSSFGYDPIHDVLYAHADRTQTKFKYGETGVTGKLELKRWTAAEAPARPEKPAAAPQTGNAKPCLSAVWFTSLQTGFAVGDRGTILKTADGGASWAVQQTAGPRDHLYALHFPTADKGCAVGYLATGFDTSDGGAAWARRLIGTKDRTLYAVHFPDARTGYATSEGSTVYKTTDGGKSWTPRRWREPGPYEFFSYAVHFTSRETGYVAGELGLLEKTTDGGATWILQTTGTKDTLCSLWFTDADTGYAVGDRGMILKTTDGGTHWVSQTSGTDSWLSAVHFPDRAIGYAVGESGTVLKTIDAGAHWLPQTSGTKNHLYSVHFPDVKAGHAVGDRGTVLKTSDGGASWALQTFGPRIPPPDLSRETPASGTWVGEWRDRQDKLARPVAPPTGWSADYAAGTGT